MRLTVIITHVSMAPPVRNCGHRTSATVLILLLSQGSTVRTVSTAQLHIPLLDLNYDKSFDLQIYNFKIYTKNFNGDIAANHPDVA